MDPTKITDEARRVLRAAEKRALGEYSGDDREIVDRLALYGLVSFTLDRGEVWTAIITDAGRAALRGAP